MKKTLLRILSLTMWLLIVMAVGIAGVSAVEDKEYLYEDIFVEYLGFYAEGYDNEGWDWYTYNELYYYYGDDKGGSTTADEGATPDYVFVEATCNMCCPASDFVFIGDYVLFTYSQYVPYSFRYHVYVPAENKIYTLEEAALSDIAGIDKVFAEAGIGDRKGDTDRDGEITIKDATEIQKNLAGLGLAECRQLWEEYFPINFIYDFDKDEEVTIKDATAIQKYIAGLEC